MAEMISPSWRQHGCREIRMDDYNTVCMGAHASMCKFLTL